jgi:hypothetical protein
MIRVIAYMARNYEFRERLEAAICEGARGEMVEVCDDVRIFARKLTNAISIEVISVMGISDESELIEAAALLEMIDDTTLILVLPSEEEKTTSIAHRLRPRFLTFPVGDFSDVSAVLSRLLERAAVNLISPGGIKSYDINNYKTSTSIILKKNQPTKII